MNKLYAIPNENDIYVQYTVWYLCVKNAIMFYEMTTDYQIIIFPDRNVIIIQVFLNYIIYFTTFSHICWNILFGEEDKI